MRPILVLIEQRAGAAKGASLEALSHAATLGGEVHALVFGPNLPPDLGRYGAAKVLHANAPQLDAYSGEASAKAVAKVLDSGDYGLVLAATSVISRDLLPRIAVTRDACIAPDCTSFACEGETYVAKRPVYAGKATLTVAAGPTQLMVASIRPNAYKAEERGAAGTVELIATDLTDADVPIRITGTRMATVGKVDLTEARIIVSGGRGIKGPENLALIEALADKLGGTVGASRAVVDAGWAPHSMQVGQTGKVVSPQLYVACGISGAIQHLAGMRTSRIIVAINKDPEAPIFKIADYGVVGDLFEIVPAITKELG